MTGQAVWLLFLAVVTVTRIEGSHFRGAIISWKPGENRNEVTIFYRISWRMTYSSRFRCDDDDILNGNDIGGTGDITCFDNCVGTLGRLDYKCTDYSTEEDWSSGRGQFTVTVTPRDDNLPVEFGFSGSDWIRVNVGGGSWRLPVTADLRPRNDTGVINTSPTAETTPVVRLQHGCNHTIVIPVGDVDNDVVRCRWASDAAECGGVCNGLPTAVLDQDTCKLSYSAVSSLGWYAVALMVEDFPSLSSTTSLSSIPVQFLVYVYDAGENATCASNIEYVDPTPPNGACIGVPYDQVYNSRLTVRLENPDETVTEFKTISPLGMTKSAVFRLTSNDWAVNITWYPGNISDVSNVFCFNARSSSGLESDSRCITLLAGVTAPSIVDGTQTPVGLVYPGQNTWTISLDTTQFRRSTRAVYIRLYSDNNVLLEDIPVASEKRTTLRPENRTVTFTTTVNLEQKQTYYFTFDLGVVKGLTQCGADTAAIRDPAFWTITIRDTTPPAIRFSSPTLTNSSSTVEWSINEPVSTALCRLTRPDGSFEEIVPCSSPWSVAGLTDGRYSFSVAATDLASNYASASHVWTVDTVPPELAVNSQPNPFINVTGVRYDWTCPYPCTVYCTVYWGNQSSSPYCSRYAMTWSVPSGLASTVFRLEVSAVDEAGNTNHYNFSWTTDYEDPVISVCSLGLSFTLDCNSKTSPEAVCNATVVDNIDSSPHLNYTDISTGSCGITRQWTATDEAGNTAHVDQHISFNTTRKMTVVSSPPSTSLSCGSLANLTDTLKSLFEVVHPCGIPVEISYTDDKTEQCGIIIRRTWTLSDGCGDIETVEQYLKIQDARKPVQPVDGQIDSDLSVLLRWDSPDASDYFEIYLWPRGTDRPKKAVENSTLDYYMADNLSPGTIYFWQIVFHYTNGDTYISPIWSFETRHYVDFVVETIDIPPSSFTGQKCEITYTVVNRGTIATQLRTWYDLVYLSWDGQITGAKSVWSRRQRNILYKGDGYSSTASFVLGERETGNAYIFVRTNAYDSVAELDTQNNQLRSESTIDVQLTPPPDLQVTSISVPGNRFFSGTDITVSWTVFNMGTGPTKRPFWYDQVWLAQNDTLDSNSRVLRRATHSGDMDVNDNYTATASVRVPDFITGDYYILVETDIYDYIYEFLGEDNNIASIQSPIYIALTPPPDLVVTSVVTNDTWTTGDMISVEWVVTNVGSDTASRQLYWQDRVSIRSGNSAFTNTYYKGHYGRMSTEDSYRGSVVFTVLPNFVTDVYTITVTTDYRDSVFEYDKEDNNERSTQVQVNRSLPDLSTESFDVDIEYLDNSTVANIVWTVRNIGSGSTLTSTWVDKIYLKTSKAAHFSEIHSITNTFKDKLKANESYTKTEHAVIPNEVFGDVVFRLTVDMESRRTGDEILYNNVIDNSDNTINLRAADLNIVSLSSSNYIQAGKEFGITYVVNNRGTRPVKSVNWTDKVFITNKADDSLPILELKKHLEITISLGVDETYTRTIGFMLPNEMVGAYFLNVVTNDADTLFEGNLKENNILQEEIIVEAAIAADFTVSTVASTHVVSNEDDFVVTINWEVQNIGNSMDFTQEWQDAVIYRQLENLIPISTFTIRRALEFMETYTRRETVVLPFGLYGDVYICVKTLYKGDVYEAGAVENNIHCTNSPISLPVLALAKLSAQITKVKPTDVTQQNLSTGSEVSISFSVENIGSIKTPMTSWIDSVYVTNKAIINISNLRQDGKRVSDILHLGSLDAGQTYDVSATFRIPFGLSGTPNIYVLVNNTASDDDGDNASESNDSNLSQSSVLDVEYVLPNLRISADLQLLNLHGGQPVSIEYEIKNTGNTSVFGTWFDSVILSDDLILDAFDVKLKSFERTLAISSNSNVFVNISFLMPFDIESKRYMLAIVCDSRDDIFESEENDNTISTEIYIQASMTTDIAVIDIVAPLTVAYGENMQITWDITNNGSQSANGYKCDSVYLSVDDVWDIADRQIGDTTCISFDLAPNMTDSLSNTLDAKPPQVIASDYNTLVKTRSNVIDINPENDIALSAQKTTVTYSTLYVGENIHHVFETMKAFRITNVTDEETLVITVSADVPITVYVKESRAATLFDFDIISDDPTSKIQTLSFQNTIQGDYYILIIASESYTSSDSIEMNVGISIKYAIFEVIDISPNSIITGAETTVKIRGTLFPMDMKVSLIFIDKANTTLSAKEVFVFSSTTAYATFALHENSSIGTANLELQSDTLDQTIQYQSLKIKNGVKGYLVSHKESTNRLRIGQTGSFVVRLQNKGDSDLPVPIVNIEALGGGSFQLIDETRQELYRKDYMLFCIASDGPAGILMPKSFCELKFVLRSDADQVTRLSMKVREVPQNDLTPNPYSGFKDALRPSHYTDETWSKIWNNFLTLTGPTSFTFGKKVSSVLNEMSVAGRRVRPVRDITNYLLRHADSPNGDSILDTQVDIASPNVKDIRLIVDRLFDSKIGSRHRKGPLGYGWMIPLWQTYIKQIRDDELVLTLHAEDILFAKGDEHIFINRKHGTITIEEEGFVMERIGEGRRYIFDKESLHLLRVESKTDDSWLEISYRNSLVDIIRHSDGTTAQTRYDDLNHIYSIELVNSTVTENVVYGYSFDGQLLTEVTRNGKTTRYAYNKDNSLKSMILSDGSKFGFEYNEFGHISARYYNQDSSELHRSEYSYTSGGMFVVSTQPEGSGYNLTFSESGDIISVNRHGFLPDRVVTTSTTQTNYEGEQIVTKRTFWDHNIMIEDGNGDSVTTTFNDAGEIVSFVDGRNNVYKMTMSDTGKLSTVTFPDNSNKSYAYSENSILVTTQNEVEKIYEYDDRNRLVKKVVGEMTENYDYNADGFIETASNDVGEITISYAGSIVSHVSYPDKTIRYKYNDQNLLTEISTNDGYSVKYGLDRLGQIRNVTDENNAMLVTAEYTDSGKIKKKTLGNNAYTEYEYDKNSGLLTSLINFYPNGTKASFFSFKYSSRNRRVSMSTLEGEWKFQYDKTGQVTSMTNPTGDETDFSYDSSKNRRSVSINGVEHRSNINNMNQYEKYRNNVYTHDRNGNLHQRNGTDGHELFIYDEDNRLRQYEANEVECQFSYDAFGELFSKTCNGKTTRYVTSIQGALYGTDIIEKVELADGKEQTTRFYHGGEKLGLIASKQDDGQLHYFLYDALGTVVNVLSENGELLNKYQRDPFGNLLASSVKVPVTFTFVGQWGVVDFTEIPDVYYMRTRLYDSYTGRFLSLDTMGLGAHSKNFYAYCANNPVSFKDPKGTCPICPVIYIAGRQMLKGAVKGAIMNVLDYGRTTPINEWSWGGAAGAAVEGAINGAFKPFKKVIPGIVTDIISDLASVAGTATQKWIDNEPYSFRDAVKDFGDKLIDRFWDKLEEKFPRFKDFNKLCGMIEKFTGSSSSLCDGKDKLKEKWRDLIDDIFDWIRSFDPNDILGPAGYGQARFIQKELTMRYTIRFENEANATAPAQRVYVEHKYSKHLDTRYFMLDTFGFGNFTKEIPSRSKIYQDTVDMRDEKGFVVQVFCGLDVVKRVIAWEFQTIDPLTGLAPTDPGIGFLPPNNGTTGQGFVSFSIRPRSDVDHLTIINANASIYFDQNDPIDAPNIFNTIDDSAPQLNGSIIPGTESKDSVTISLKSTDSGAGVERVELFRKIGDTWNLYKENITDTIYVLQLDSDVPQLIYPLPIDFVGNRPDILLVDPDTAIYVNITLQPVACECSGNGNCTDNTGFCECYAGFYGTYCNRTTPPLEPPVLELRSGVGYAGEPITLTISARNVSGLREDLSIIVSNVPHGTVFSKGQLTESGELQLASSDFGQLNLTTTTFGDLDLIITVIQTHEDQRMTRSAKLQVTVYPSVQRVDVLFAGCVSNDQNNTVLFTSKVVFIDSLGNENMNISSALSHEVTFVLPTWVRPEERLNTDGVYVIDAYIEQGKLEMVRPFEDFNITIIIRVNPAGVYTKEYSFLYEINSNCSEGTCDCIEDHTSECNPSFGQCLCLPGWTGSRCETDVDECSSSTICSTVVNTVCRNKDGGYECVCPEGFTNDSGVCVETATVTTAAIKEKILVFTVKLDIDVPPIVDLSMAETFNSYKTKIHKTMLEYFSKKIGKSLIRIIILALRRGSLIVDQNVAVENNQESIHTLVAAVQSLTTFTNSSTSELEFDGNKVVVQEVRLPDGKAADACAIYTQLNPCGSGCEVNDQGQPTCRVDKDDTDNDKRILIIIIVVASVLFLIIVVAVVAVSCRGRHQDKSLDLSPTPSNHPRDPGTSGPRFSNPAYGGGPSTTLQP